MRKLDLLNDLGQIKEAFETRRSAKGQVKFSKSSMNDAHVKKVIKHIANVSGRPVSEIENEINDKVKEFADLHKIAPILYGTIVNNIVEDELFSLLQKTPDDKTKAPRWNNITFRDLIRRIKIEHDEFFPLRNFIDHKYLRNFNIIPVPDPNHPKYDRVETAAATEKGDFIFNIDFMNKLLEYAYMKDINPKGKKYSNNGGDIPKEWAYIEFVIIHEFMHYTYADFHYGKIIKDSKRTILNWVGDFRTNYLLVKSGFEQLPFGLFNDEINYDRQDTYQEMYDIVESEFKKLNKAQQQKVQGKLDGLSDDHQAGDPPPGDTEDGEPTEGEPSEGPESKTPEDIDKANKGVEEKMDKGKDLSGEEANKEEANKEAKRQKTGGGSTSGNKSDTGRKEFDYSKVQPTFSWQQILQRCISDAASKTEETYQKPSRRGITNADIARQIGAGAVKPGEVAELTDIKLAFVVDSSGSMDSAIAKVYSNIASLLKKHPQMVAGDFYVIKYSNDFHIYACNLKKRAYAKIDSVKDKKKDFNAGSIDALFKETIGSGTNFDKSLVETLAQLAKEKYNILLFTDTDILYGTNLDNFKELYALAKKQLFVLADCKDTFIKLIQAMKQMGANISYIEDEKNK